MAIDLRAAKLAALGALLAGCAEGLQKDDALKQVNERLSEAQAGCVLIAEYKGVGEGDADTVYITVALRRERAGASNSSRDVELMFGHHEHGGWVITDDSSRELATAAEDICLE